MDEGHEIQMQEQIGEIQKHLTVITSLPSLSEEQINEIGGRLGVIYNEAEKQQDTALMATAMDTWIVLQATSTTSAIAVSALTGLIEAVQQRDSALDELGRIEDGISELESEGETSHPRLRGAAHVLYETLRDRWEDEGLHLDCPGCQAHDTGWGDDVDHDAVNLMCHALWDGLGEELSTELRQEFGEFIAQWTQKIEDHLERQQIKHREAS